MWHRIIQIKEWFGENYDRYKTIKEFNANAKMAYISGESKTLIKAKITKGENRFRHSFSKWMSAGFNIQAMSGRPLTRPEMVDIGDVIISNEGLVRMLLSLGWDTLEVHDNAGKNGLKWELSKYSGIGGVLD
jgi:hypothetical protein